MHLAPSFFFIDPFGFKGIPLPIIKEILSFPKTEILFTFMARDLNRFLDSPKHEDSCAELFGDICWKEIINSDNREHVLVDLYRRKLVEVAGVKYTLPFRVCGDELRATTYYLIHASNHIEAFRLMKDITYNQSKGRFGFFGPDDKIVPLSQFFDTIPETRKYLLNKFSGNEITFKKMVEESYLDVKNVAPAKDLRAAIKELYSEGIIELSNIGKRGGINEYTIIKFP